MLQIAAAANVDASWIGDRVSLKIGEDVVTGGLSDFKRRMVRPPDAPDNHPSRLRVAAVELYVGGRCYRVRPDSSVTRGDLDDPLKD